jgi:hypothetical protein
MLTSIHFALLRMIARSLTKLAAPSSIVIVIEPVDGSDAEIYTNREDAAARRLAVHAALAVQRHEKLMMVLS